MPSESTLCMPSIAAEPVILRNGSASIQKGTNNALKQGLCHEPLRTVNDVLAEERPTLKGWKDIRVLEISKVTEIRTVVDH